MKTDIDIVHIQKDNSNWELSLPTYETLMIKKAVSTYEASSIGYKEEEYTDAIIKVHEYQNIKRIYNSKTSFPKGTYSRFNPKLTLEEAVKKYIGCDMETAEQISEKLKESKKNGILWEKSIRESYNGDLSTQLGMDKEPFVIDAEKIDEATKKMTEMINESAKKNGVELPKDFDSLFQLGNSKKNDKNKKKP